MGLMDTLGTIAGVMSPAFGKKLFAHRAENEQAEAEYEAQQRALDAQRGAHVVDEEQRAARLEAIQGLLGGLGIPGMENVQFDPAALATMKKARPFTGTMGADPKAGARNAFISGLLGDIHKAGTDAAMMMAGVPPSSLPNMSANQSTRPTENALTKKKQLPTYTRI